MMITRKVPLASHPAESHDPPYVRINVHPHFADLGFHTFWHEVYTAMTHDELRQVRDAITQALDQAEVEEREA